MAKAACAESPRGPVHAPFLSLVRRASRPLKAFRYRPGLILAINDEVAYRYLVSRHRGRYATTSSADYLELLNGSGNIQIFIFNGNAPEIDLGAFRTLINMRWR